MATEQPTIGKSVGIGIACALSVAWCCMVITQLTIFQTSAGGLLGIIAGIVIAIRYRNGYCDASTAFLHAAIVGAVIGWIIVAATLVGMTDQLPDIASTASALADQTGDDFLAIRYLGLEVLASGFAEGRYFGSIMQFFLIGAIWTFMAIAIPGGISIALDTVAKRKAKRDSA